MGYVASEWSSSVGPRPCTSVHWYRYVVEVSRGVGRVVLGAWCLHRQGVLSPILLIGPRRGALVLVYTRTHGRETIAESDVDAIPGVRSVDSHLS